MTTSEFPFVSMCLTSYNQRQYVVEAVVAALSQDYPNYELIISDDGSTDGSIDAIRECISNVATKAKNVTLLTSSSNIGIARNYEKMFSVAKGVLLVGADGDDVSLQNRISVVVKAWLSDGMRATVITHDAFKIDPTGRERGTVEGRTIAAPLGAVMAYSRVGIEKFGKISERDAIQDYVYSFRNSLFGSALHINEKLVRYRIGTGISSLWNNRRTPELRMTNVRAACYRQQLEDLSFVREKISSADYNTRLSEIEEKLSVESLRRQMISSQGLIRRFMAWRSLYPKFSKAAMIFFPYVLPAWMGDLLFGIQLRIKFWKKS